MPATPTIARHRLPQVGALLPGPRNASADVPGVRVGRTMADGGRQTGVGVIVPHAGDPFQDRVPAAAHVINGFGKSVGLVQVEELGVLETPIALTNTFAVGAVAQAQIRQAIAANPETGRSLSTVQPTRLRVQRQLPQRHPGSCHRRHYRAACAAASAEVVEGSVGAGRGMSSFGLKGGIGTASRRVTLPAAGETAAAITPSAPSFSPTSAACRKSRSAAMRSAARLPNASRPSKPHRPP